MTFVEFVNLASSIYREGLRDDTEFISEESAVFAAKKIVDCASKQYTELVVTKKIEAE